MCVLDLVVCVHLQSYNWCVNAGIRDRHKLRFLLIGWGLYQIECTGCLNNKSKILRLYSSELYGWKCSNSFFWVTKVGTFMATLSVFNFCTLSHVHSAPKWILEKTHISSSLIRSGVKTSQFSIFLFSFQ